MNPDEPGSAKRAFLGWRSTASALLFLWAPVPFAWRVLIQEPEGFEDLAFVVLAVLAYAVAVVVLIPAFAFTIGRAVDRRTTPRGVRRSAISFAIWGAGFGLVMVLLVGFGATALGAAVLLFVPALAAAVGRLLVELRGRGWAIAIWVTFTMAVLAATALAGTVVISVLQG